LRARSGYFSLLDASTGMSHATHAVDTAGAALLCAAVGDAGEAVAFGDGGGFVHLFVRTTHPAAVCTCMHARTRTHTYTARPLTARHAPPTGHA
jgi:hypothetical protein